MRVPARDLGFFFPYLLVGAIFSVVHLSGQLRGLGLVVAFVLIPIVDRVIGLDKVDLTRAQEAELDEHWFYRGLLLGWVPVQLGLMSLGVYKLMEAEAAGGVPLWLAFVLGIPLGLGNGGIGITVAHELGHRANFIDRWAARILLVSVGYGHFTIEHNRGHHVRVGTFEDPATARLGEGFFRFYLRTVPTQWLHAWRLENERCRRAYGRATTLRNHMVWLTLAPMGIAAGMFALGGPVLLVYFISQAVFAFSLLEAVNYVEHYGLLREERDGKLEKVQPHHSWNASHFLTNYLLFRLQRHSDHHAFAGRRYQLLRHVEGAPQLPAGYPSMILLALVPPLWRRVMDKRVMQARAAASQRAAAA